MSDAGSVMDSTGVDPSRYTGSDRYIRVAEDFLDVELTAVQRRILRAMGEHQRVLVISGNGVGKSYTAAIANAAFLIRHPESTALATSGTYSVLSDVLWKPLKSMWRDTDLPGRCLQSPPRIEIGDSWYFKAVSPRYPESLEGRHAGALAATLEERDKPDITQEHFDSAESLLTGDRDRILAISNPPEDESNVVYDLMEDDRWHTIQFSSFDSHNVQVDAGEINDDRIEGLVDLETIREDWRNWNGEEWPGLETARTVHLTRDILDIRWYRRRAGVIPPEGSAAHRPFDVGEVESAWSRVPTATTNAPSAVGIDVARSGDRTVMIGVHGDQLQVHYAERGADHTTQESQLRRILDEWPDVTVAIDAVGEGSGLGDRLQQAYPDVHRFKAGGTADEETEFKDCWSEGLYTLGSWLADGGAIDDHHLREELLVAARTVTFDERHYLSRGRNGATVLQASSKGEVKDSLGRSPDYLDASVMACWAASGHATRTRRITRRGPPGKRGSSRSGGDDEDDETAESTAESKRVVRRRSPTGSSHNGRGRRASDRDVAAEKSGIGRMTDD